MFLYIYSTTQDSYEKSSANRIHVTSILDQIKVYLEEEDIERIRKSYDIYIREMGECTMTDFWSQTLSTIYFKDTEIFIYPKINT